MRTWMWWWSLSSNEGEMFRGSCEASGLLFRTVNLKFFQIFFLSSRDCSYIASTVLLVKLNYLNVFFCFRHFYGFYHSSTHIPRRFHHHFQHTLFRDGLIVLTCIVFYDVYHLQLRMRRRSKKMKSFHLFVFNHFFSLWISICQTNKFSCRQGHCSITLKRAIFILLYNCFVIYIPLLSKVFVPTRTMRFSPEDESWKPS